MWEGLTGKRRRYGIYGLIIGVAVSSMLLYLSFYISFLYLLIPVLLLVIFHYTKLWRFSDRAFYGFFAILIAFFIAMGGISTSITGAPNHSTAVLSVSNTTSDIHYNYYNDAGNYTFNFSLPAAHILSNTTIKLVDLFTGVTLLSRNATLVTSGSNYSYSWSTGKLLNHAYIVNMTLNVLKNNTSKKEYVEFLGPVLISSLSVILLLSESLIISYLLITVLFYLAFAFFARAMSTSRRKKPKGGDRNPPVSVEQPVLEQPTQEKRGWFRRRNY